MNFKRLCYAIGCVALLLAASAAMAGERNSPAFKRTLEKARSGLIGAQLSGVEFAALGQANRGQAPMVTSAPGKQTICSGSKTIVCTESPSSSTKCGSGSLTACTTDPNCGPTTRPSGTTTKCRTEHTKCQSGAVINCTSSPPGFTRCVYSNTNCVGTDAACFTYLPSPQTTICPTMLTMCWFNQPVRCTREAASPTTCTQFSNTRCTPSDYRCMYPTVTDWTMIDPNFGARGTTITSLLAFSGDNNDLVVGGGDVTFGEGIDVLDFEVVSPVEGWVTIQISPMAALGPRNVFFASGDDGVPPGAHIIHPGIFTVTEAIPTLSTWGLVALLLVLGASAFVFLRRRQLAAA